MRDPFKIDGPAVISFSGGRTSGYLLWRVLQAHGGALPANVLVCFQNTGVEREETLAFIDRCSREWGVPVVWLEYRYEGRHRAALDETAPAKRKRNGTPGFAVVDFVNASRNGEPFEAVIRARNMLPNPVTRFCTVELKIRTLARYVKSLGWEQWTNCIGFRADEPQRVAKLRRNSEAERSGEEAVTPLHKAGVTKADVMAFWKAHPFDLGIDSDAGNCTLCFLKGQGKLERLMKGRPDLAEWWVRMESLIVGGRSGTGRFRSDRPSYAAMLERSQRASLPMMGDDDEDQLSVACHCTD